MADRARLHELIDTLPDAALAVAQGSLEHLQTWPPQVPARIKEIRDQGFDRMRAAVRPGTGGGGGGGGSYRVGPGGRIEYGTHSHSHWDGDTVVITTHRFHAGYELVTHERLRLEPERGELTYTHEITGPDGNVNQSETVFKVKPQ